MDTVFIRGLRIDTVIGIHDWERRITQTIVLDLELGWDNTRPAQSRDIGDALDYDAIARRVSEFVATAEALLIETLAEDVAALLQAEFGIPWLHLRLEKPGAVASADTVGVAIERGQRR